MVFGLFGIILRGFSLNVNGCSLSVYRIVFGLFLELTLNFLWSSNGFSLGSLVFPYVDLLSILFGSVLDCLFCSLGSSEFPCFNLPWIFTGISFGWSWIVFRRFLGPALDFLWNSIGFSVGYLIFLHVDSLSIFFGVSMDLIWGLYWIAFGIFGNFCSTYLEGSLDFTGFYLDFLGLSLELLISSLGSLEFHCMDFLWIFLGVSMDFFRTSLALGGRQFGTCNVDHSEHDAYLQECMRRDSRINANPVGFLWILWIRFNLCYRHSTSNSVRKWLKVPLSILRRLVPCIPDRSFT